MYDQLFRLMAASGHASWRVAGAWRSPTGPVEVSTPHDLADAATFLRAVEPLFRTLPRRVARRDEPVPAAVPASRGQTRLQAVLKHLLAESHLPLPPRLAMAVAVEGSGRNRVAFPTLTASELVDLLERDGDAWKAALRDAAAQHLTECERVLQRLAGLTPEEQARLFRALPLNRCGLVLSSWGSLDRRLHSVDPDVRDDLDFAVTATAGPDRIAVLWSVGETFKLRVSRPPQTAPAWDEPVLKLGVAHA